jgi:hypothetical protein
MPVGSSSRIAVTLVYTLKPTSPFSAHRIKPFTILRVPSMYISASSTPSSGGDMVPTRFRNRLACKNNNKRNVRVQFIQTKMELHTSLTPYRTIYINRYTPSQNAYLISYTGAVVTALHTSRNSESSTNYLLGIFAGSIGRSGRWQ